MSNADELAKLDALRKSGVLTQEEFETEKAKLLGGASPLAESGSSSGAESSQGAVWWQASDGKWCAPELHPDYEAAPVESPASSVPPVESPSKHSRQPYKRWAVAVVVVIVVIAVAVGGNKPKSNASAPTTPSTTAPMTSPPTTAAPTTTVPSGPKTTFGDGTWAVGIQIAPGTYQTNGGSGCYWETDSNLTGNESATIANGDTSGHVVVTVLPSDAGFTTQSCGTWTPLPATGPKATTFGDGIWAVDINIAPGTYSTSGGSGCYWETDSDLTGSESATIANDLPTGPATITILSTDEGFRTQSCGTWTHIG